MEKDQKIIKSAKILIVLILVCLGIGISVSILFSLQVIAGIIAGFGLFFLTIPLYNQKESKRILKDSKKCFARATESKYITEREEDVIVRFYYQNTYEIIDNGIVINTITKEEDHNAELDKMLSAYYNPSKEELIFERELEDLSSRKNIVAPIIVSFVLFLIAGAVQYFTNIYTKRIFNMVSGGEIFALIFISVFICIGIALIVSSVKKKKTMESSQMVQGKIIGYDKSISHHDSGSSVTYAPIYEYRHNGEMKQYQSNLYKSGRKKQVGSTEELYLTEDGQILTKRDINGTLKIGIIFTIMGTLFMVVAILSVVGVI